MRRSAFILFFLMMICTVSAQINVAPGMKMPGVDATWLIQQKKLDRKANKKFLEAVVFSDLASPDIVQTLRYVESLESKFNRTNSETWDFRFQVVVPNSEEDVNQFLKTSGLPFSVALGADRNGRTFRNFVVAKVPEAVIGVDGAIAWIGPAMDLDYIIGELTAGTFSLQTYKNISQMKQEMQTALRSGLPEVAAKTAEKILETVPADNVAIQTILYSYELKNQNGKAIAFLEDRVAKCGEKAPGIRLLLLDRILRTGDMELWIKAVEKAVSQKMSPDDRLNLAAFLIDRPAKMFFPVKFVPQLCADILNDPAISSDPEFHANALEIAARSEYMVCRIDKACKFQEQAVSLRKETNSPLLPRSIQTLTFYQDIKALPVTK